LCGAIEAKMDYVLGKKPVQLNVQGQIIIPRNIVNAICNRNEPKQSNKLYLKLEYAQTDSKPLPFLKCFDHCTLEHIVKERKETIHPGQIEGHFNMGLDGRLCIPEQLRKMAQLNLTQCGTTIVEACSEEWGFSFGIYNLDIYHEVQAYRMFNPMIKELETAKRE
jgi:hypothetical protein